MNTTLVESYHNITRNTIHQNYNIEDAGVQDMDVSIQEFSLIEIKEQLYSFFFGRVLSH